MIRRWLKPRRLLPPCWPNPMCGEVEGQLAATCQLGVIPTLTNGGRPFGIIEHVITAARFRRQGLSQQVLEQALALAWQQDCYKVMLLSGEGREAAHRLYEKLGFKAGIEKGFVIKQTDAKGTAETLR